MTKVLGKMLSKENLLKKIDIKKFKKKRKHTRLKTFLKEQIYLYYSVFLKFLTFQHIVDLYLYVIYLRYIFYKNIIFVYISICLYLQNTFKVPIYETTTPSQLIDAVNKTRPMLKQLPGYDLNINTFEDMRNFRVRKKLDCDEVYPNIYIGDG